MLEYAMHDIYQGGLTLRVARPLELQVGGDPVDVRVELHAALGALLLRAQLALLVLPAGRRA